MVPMPQAELQLTHRRGRCIVFHEHWNLQVTGEQPINRHGRPRSVCGRLAGQLRPLDLVGKRNTDAQHLPRFDARLLEKMPDGALEEALHGFRQRKLDLTRSPRPYRPQEVQHHQRDVIAIDIHSDGVAAIGIDDEPDRWLASRPAHSSCFPDQLTVHQAPGDACDGRRRKPGDVRQIRTCDRAAHADRMQRDALIMIARALEIRPRQPQATVAAALRPAADFRIVRHRAPILWLAPAASARPAPPRDMSTIKYIYFLYSPPWGRKTVPCANESCTSE